MPERDSNTHSTVTLDVLILYPFEQWRMIWLLMTNGISIINCVNKELKDETNLVHVRNGDSNYGKSPLFLLRYDSRPSVCRPEPYTHRQWWWSPPMTIIECNAAMNAQAVRKSQLSHEPNNFSKCYFSCVDDKCIQLHTIISSNTAYKGR